MELFASSSSSSGPVPAESRKKRGRSSSDGGETAPSSSSSSSSSSHKNYDDARSFAELGLCDWLCQSTTAIGFARPFDIQRACIPAILAGRDVLGCAETGSGKTAAFALPILHHLSQDPYGVFAIVLTPTRELATQIAEQFSALGAAMGVRVALVIGGMNMMQQAATLAQRPHVVIATPGRLRHHLESAAPPAVGRALYLVLDEADRLMAPGFASELQVQWIGRPCFKLFSHHSHLSIDLKICLQRLLADDTGGDAPAPPHVAVFRDHDQVLGRTRKGRRQGGAALRPHCLRLR